MPAFLNPRKVGIGAGLLAATATSRPAFNATYDYYYPQMQQRGVAGGFEQGVDQRNAEAMKNLQRGLYDVMQAGKKSKTNLDALPPVTLPAGVPSIPRRGRLLANAIALDTIKKQAGFSRYIRPVVNRTAPYVRPVVANTALGGLLGAELGFLAGQGKSTVQGVRDGYPVGYQQGLATSGDAGMLQLFKGLEELQKKQQIPLPPAPAPNPTNVKLARHLINLVAINKELAAYDYTKLCKAAAVNAGYDLRLKYAALQLNALKEKRAIAQQLVARIA